MGRGTRQTILDEAKKLFSARGYNAVSMNDIAQAVGISKGNLTYHFKKKEDIIAALLKESEHEIDRKVPSSLEEMNALFFRLRSVVEDNAYYFWHYAQLAQLSPEIRSMQDEAIASNRTFLTSALEALEDELLIDLSSCESKECLVNTLLLTAIYWLPFNDVMKTSSVSFLDQMWSILTPFFTRRGATKFAALER